MAAPDGSVTVPTFVASCADATTAKARTSKQRIRKRDIFQCFTIISLSVCNQGPDAQLQHRHLALVYFGKEYGPVSRGKQLITVSGVQQLLIKTN